MNFPNITEGDDYSDSTQSERFDRRGIMAQSVPPEVINRSGRIPKITNMSILAEDKYLLLKNGERISNKTVLFIYGRYNNEKGYKFSYVKDMPETTFQYLFRCNNCIRSGYRRRKCSAIIEIQPDDQNITVYVQSHPRDCIQRFIPQDDQNGSLSHIEDVIDEEENEPESDRHSSTNENSNIFAPRTAEQLYFGIPSRKRLRKICKIFQIQYQEKFLQKWFSIYKNVGISPITQLSTAKETCRISPSNSFSCLSMLLTSSDSEEFGTKIKHGIKKYFCDHIMSEVNDVGICKLVCVTDDLEEIHLCIFAEMTKLCIAILTNGKLEFYGSPDKPMILLTKVENKFVPVESLN